MVFVESPIAAFKGRTIHSFHTEGAGGGHAPDIIKVCGEPNVIPSLTTPTRLCGPTSFVETATRLLIAAGISDEMIKTERFGPTGDRK